MASDRALTGLTLALVTLTACLLAACTLQTGIEQPPETPAPYDESDLMTRGAATFAASTSTPTGEAASPQPTGTVTPTSTATEPASDTAPPAASAPPEPAIDQFEVSPTSGVTTGDVLTVRWSTTSPGEPVVLCILQPIPGMGQERCLEGLAESGERTVEITEQVDGPLVLTLTVGSGDSPLTAVRRVTWDCSYRWDFDTGMDLCPARDAIITTAAAQPFERGWMFYLIDPGLYIILTSDPEPADSDGQPYYLLADPLNVTQDTSQGVIPPEGLYAPESGFGLVWRGDASGGGYQDVLGWALEREFNFTATFQCDNARSQWRFCYVTDTQGRPLVLHPLGTWKPLD